MNKKRLRVLAAVLAAALCLAGVAAASGGTAQDPLITLSYLQQTFLPDVLKQVDQKAADKADELEAALNEAIDGYSDEMEQALASGGGTGTANANYTVVTLSEEQVLDLEIGAEVMLRVGSASCGASSSPGLIDCTDGTTLNDGGALKTNHLYMATIEDRWVTAESGTVKVLARGGYSVR